MKMRRAERQVHDLGAIQKIVQSCKICRLAMEDEEGLYIVPMSPGARWEGEHLTLYFHSAGEGRKIAALRKNPRCAFEMDCGHALRTSGTACGHSFFYRSIMGTGTIRPLPDREEKRAGLGAIMEHMTGRGWDFPDEAVDRTAVFALEVTAWTAKANQAG